MGIYFTETNLKQKWLSLGLKSQLINRSSSTGKMTTKSGSLFYVETSIYCQSSNMYTGKFASTWQWAKLMDDSEIT